jgi:hypothetical protein
VDLSEFEDELELDDELEATVEAQGVMDYNTSAFDKYFDFDDDNNELEDLEDLEAFLSKDTPT